jgi:hypothetical protein
VHFHDKTERGGKETMTIAWCMTDILDLIAKRKRQGGVMTEGDFVSKGDMNS